MKVTKLIREYIEESVAKKFEPAFAALEAQDETAKKKEAILQWEDEMRQFLRTEFRSRFGDWYDVYNKESINNIGVSVSWRLESDFIGNDKLKQKKDDLRKRQEQAVKDILIELELGGTKKDLDRLLSEIKVEV